MSAPRPAAQAGGPAPAGGRSAPKVRAALTRYRVLAWVTGFSLLLLTYTLLRYVPGLEGTPAAASISDHLGPIHGALYIVLLVTTFDLGTCVQWPWKRMLLTALAGTVPFLSFVAEHKNQRAVRTWLAGR